MAVMVHPGLFVGSAHDTYKFAGSILHCARDPWFKEAMQGLVIITAPNALPAVAVEIEYNEMALNMVDAEDPKYFSDDMINAGLSFITERFAEGDPVLCHCNEGKSRSPSLSMLWMFEHGFLDDDFQIAVAQFKGLYPKWEPNNGIWMYLTKRCSNGSTNG